MNFNKEHVNQINTPTWVKMNEDAGKLINRKIFLQSHGGSFKTNGRYVKWVEEPDYSQHDDKYVVKTPENKIDLIEVFSRYCKENKLNKAAMYGTLRGVRNHHKGYKLLKIPQ
tara:strand:+ start:211 stop:549 length:339 start_codon:yes stop_codon:yes gene_type:complete